MKEAMRLHPSICFPLERVVPPEGANICGYDLPWGTIVGILAPLVNRSKAVFGQDADTFRPERWLEAEPERLKMMERTFSTVNMPCLKLPTSLFWKLITRAYQFGHGARGCVGKNIAMLEMTKVLPEIIRRFDVKWASGAESWTTVAGWFWKQKDIELTFKPRPSSWEKVPAE